MDRDYLAKLCDARDTLCGYCGVYECEDCVVTHLIDNAFNEGVAEFLVSEPGDEMDASAFDDTDDDC